MNLNDWVNSFANDENDSDFEGFKPILDLDLYGEHMPEERITGSQIDLDLSTGSTRFGNSLQQWIKLFTTNVTAVVNVNGWFTSYFYIEKGTRQGDPIAAYLFILCAELLGRKVRIDENVKGIKIGDNMYRICEFAGDTLMFFDGTRASLDKCLEILLQFSYISGLAINFGKNKCI